MNSLRGRISAQSLPAGLSRSSVLLGNPGEEVAAIEGTKLVVKRVDFVPGVGEAFDFCKRGIQVVQLVEDRLVMGSKVVFLLSGHGLQLTAETRGGKKGSRSVWLNRNIVAGSPTFNRRRLFVDLRGSDVAVAQQTRYVRSNAYPQALQRQTFRLRTRRSPTIIPATPNARSTSIKNVPTPAATAPPTPVPTREP